MVCDVTIAVRRVSVLEGRVLTLGACSFLGSFWRGMRNHGSSQASEARPRCSLRDLSSRLTLQPRTPAARAGGSACSRSRATARPAAGGARAPGTLTSLDHFLRISQLDTTQHTPRAMCYLVTMLIGRGFVLETRWYDLLAPSGPTVITRARRRRSTISQLRHPPIFSPDQRSARRLAAAMG